MNRRQISLLFHDRLHRAGRDSLIQGGIVLFGHSVCHAVDGFLTQDDCAELIVEGAAFDLKTCHLGGKGLDCIGVGQLEEVGAVGGAGLCLGGDAGHDDVAVAALLVFGHELVGADVFQHLPGGFGVLALAGDAEAAACRVHRVHAVNRAVIGGHPRCIQPALHNM